jgi:short-subunit dehydrogenase
MKTKLKPLDEQTIVITGASSGIGLVTARMAARQGANVVLAARSGDALWRLEQEINEAGGQAAHVVADVSRVEDVAQIARVAIERFGGFDTWVNNAGISIYGRIEDVSLEDMRRLFDTNFWGLIHGSLEAAKHLRNRGGAIIQIGSEVGERAIPLQGIYSASKHAVKGFTDAFRMELEKDGAPISVTLVKPAAIDTPYTHHAKNYLEVEPKHAPPVYAPEVVAEAVLHAAQAPIRDIFAGGAGRLVQSLSHHAPRFVDSAMERSFFEQTKSSHPPHPREENGLERPSGTLQERGGHEGYVSKRSLYTKAVMHPVLTGAMVVGALLAVGAASTMRNGDEEKSWWE